MKPSISREERGFHQCYSISKMTELSLSIVARSTCSTALASYSTRSTAVVLAASFTMCGRAAASQAFICVACIFMPAAAAAGRADLLTSRTTPAAVVASFVHRPLPDRPRAPSRPQPCGRVRGRRSPPLSPPDPHPPLRAHRYGSGCGRCRR